MWWYHYTLYCCQDGNKLRKQQEKSSEIEELDDEGEDDFDKIYKGEVSKSGTAILPSKRVRRIPEKINFKEDNEKNTDQEKEANPKPEQDLSSEEEKAEK